MGSFSSTTHGPFVLRTSTVKLEKQTHTDIYLKTMLTRHIVDVYRPATSQCLYCVIRFNNYINTHFNETTQQKIIILAHPVHINMIFVRYSIDRRN